MLISFIIPLYNGEKYIMSCLDSLLNQNISKDEYEIIVVNDGSTDNGPRIVNSYHTLHPNIILINQTNQGVGIARNNGISKSQGKYICFIDSDDELIDGAIGHILEKAIKQGDHPDLIFYDRHFITHPEFQQHNQFSFTDANVFFDGNVKDFILRHGIRAFVTSFIFKRNQLDDIKFNNYKVGEDLCFMMNVYDNIKAHIIAFDSRIYLYKIWRTSAVHSSSKCNCYELVRNYISIYHKIRSGEILKNYTDVQRYSLTVYAINFFAFSKIFATSYKLKELRELLKECNSVGFFDFEMQNGNLYRSIEYLAHNPLMTWLTSPLYRYIYIPFFKKG